MECEKEGITSSKLCVLQGVLKEDHTLDSLGKTACFIREFICEAHLEKNINQILMNYGNFEFNLFPLELSSECERLIDKEEQNKFIEKTGPFWYHPTTRSFSDAFTLTNCTINEFFMLLAYGLDQEILAKEYAGEQLFNDEWRNKGTGKLKYVLHSIEPPNEL